LAASDSAVLNIQDSADSDLHGGPQEDAAAPGMSGW